MDVATALPPSLMVSSGFLPIGSLLEALIHISNEIASIEKLPLIQTKNISTMIRRIKLLSSLFEEIQESSTPLPPSSILCLTEIFSVIRRVKLLIIHGCKEGSSLWNLVQIHSVSNQFQALVKEIGRALDILPLSLLKITADTREQVELLHKQAKRMDLFVESRDVQRRDELFQAMAANKEKKNSLDFGRLKEILSGIGLTILLDYDEEISKLETEAKKQAGTGGLIVVSNINNLISLVSLSKTMIFSPQESTISTNQQQLNLLNSKNDHSNNPDIPVEYRCPISLDFMRDPVIISSGHTYDRNSISQWINSGHNTCPKTGQRLIHMALIPNYALKGIVHQWCQDNNIPITDEATSSSSSSSQLERSRSNRKSYEKAIDNISAMKTAIDAAKMTAEFLVGKLATGSQEIQRQAAYELRLLAKTGMENRRIIAEAGAIPFLVTLLNSHDPRIQENAITALLNLSLFDNNKILIMAASAINGIIEVLQSGRSMEARENAAATVYSLSMIDDFKATIGAHPKAIMALVCLLTEGTTSGKRDAATALLNLAVYNVNRVNIVASGAVPLLIDLLMDDKAGITDEALSVLSLLLGCSEGLTEIRKSRVLVPLLIDLLRFGSPKGKENSITLILGLCKEGGQDVARRLLINPRSIPSLQSLAGDGSLKARRKAEALLRLLDRCCSQSFTHDDAE
ncbi:U-box domain-containing protein 1-like [Impatiens glandulifera]|uniref:U-box domain-containing protein 1-like n=1 Tax=Impatiens glandulifera TaxID=253017 RepID=UPI001FB1058B|nr:U-box domain-containing protein 1-like [Impatiens glandulifera]